ncbi:hypothetical protein ACFT54_09645 [Streptomyces cinereoruber]|uniref:hypothetical protein n=1 Tax=Streptomyces cinereoruber TaxID=67260 RepID=UPI0036335761
MRTRSRIDHVAAATAAKSAPGVFTFVGVYRTRPAAESATDLITSETAPFYRPARAYEAYAAPHEDGTAVWVRYVQDVADLEPLPQTMTYRVCDRGTGPGYEGVRVVTVTVDPWCPRCGGPRGKARPYRFCEDGDYYGVHQWDNPCGHVDMYSAVLAEARERTRRLEQAAARAACSCENGVINYQARDREFVSLACTECKPAGDAR